jgi:hypothetical protein
LWKPALLTTDYSPVLKEQTIEPAHEALLRQWEALRRWLQEDTVALRTLDGVQSAAADWSQGNRADKWLIHETGRLEDAERLRQREDFARFYEPVHREYLDACKVRENERKNEALAAQQRELDARKREIEAQKRATQRTRLGLAVAGAFAVVALGAALWGFSEADVAEQEAKKAEQRSAMLAANIARGLTDEGSLDAALLLLLQGSRWFDDKSAPDEYRIGFTKVLEKKSLVEVAVLFPNMQLYETDAALILVNPATNDIFTLKDSLSPNHVYTGSTSDSPVHSLRQGTQPNELLVVRKSLVVQSINIDTKSVRTVASFPKLDAALGKADDDDIDVRPNGLVIRTVAFSSGPNKDSGRIQILDSQSGRILEGKAPPLSGRTEYLRHSNGTIYAFLAQDGPSGRLLVLAPEKGVISWKPAHLDDNALDRLRFGHCYTNGLNSFRPAILEQLKNFSSSLASSYDCRRQGGELLLTTTSCGASGSCSRNDEVFGVPSEVESNGTGNIKDMLHKAVPDYSSPNNLTWVGLGDGKGLFGALLNRDALVIDQGERVLAYRHQTRPKTARFAGPDRLLVVEPASGQVVAHNFRAEPARYGTVSAATKAGIDNPDKPIAALHHGTCASLESDDVLPDGRRIFYDAEASSGTASDRRYLRVAGDKEMFEVELDGSCTSFSRDWKFLLISAADRVTIYDFDRVLASRKLAGAELGQIPGEMTSAFFIGSSSSVATTDRSNRVLLWKNAGSGKAWTSSELFRGNNSVVYAEPDSTGTMLLLLELIEQTVIGSLYSVTAKQTWFDLGSEYKWLSATFSGRQEIIVSKAGSRVAWAIPSLSELVDAAKKQLLPSCQPVRAGDYRSLPCWPASYE